MKRVPKSLPLITGLALLLLSATLASAENNPRHHGSVHVLSCDEMLQSGSGSCLITLRSKIGGTLKVKLRPTLARGLSPTKHFHANAFKHQRRFTVAASTVGDDLRISLTNFRRRNFFMSYTLSRQSIQRHGDGEYGAQLKRMPGYLKLGCGTDTVSQVLQQNDQVANTLALSQPLSASELDVWAVADTDFVTLYSSTAEAEMQDAENWAVALYQSDLDITLSTENTLLSSTNGLTSSDADTLLGAFKTYGNSQSSPLRDAAILFSGKDFNGSTLGLAFFEVVCKSPTSAYGVIEGTTSAITKIIFSHELGHIIGAAHDPQNEGVMKPSLSGDMSFFSAFSISEVTNYLASYGSCVTGSSSFTATLALTLSEVGDTKQKFKFSIKPSGSSFDGYRLELWGATACNKLNDASLLASQAMLVGTLDNSTLNDGVTETINAKSKLAKSGKLCFRLAVAEEDGSNPQLTGSNKKVTLKTGGKSSASKILTQLADKIVGP